MYNYHTEAIVTRLPDDQVFVFGSNLAGLHRGGAARTAKDHFGALQGVGRGWSGQSFAIPTLNEHFQPMPLSQIEYYLQDFKLYTKNHPKQTYFITAIGCGGAGYQPKDIAPLFKDIANNVILPIRFQKYLENLNGPLILRWDVLAFLCNDRLIFADSDQQNEFIKDNRALSPEEKQIVKKSLLKQSYNDENQDRILNAVAELQDCFNFQNNSESSMIFVSKLLNLLDEYQTDLTTFKHLWKMN